MRIIEKHVIFMSNTEGYKYFRIPVIIKAANGSILAFCEGRKHSIADNGRIDIVMKRSKDDGITWGKLHIAVTDGTNTVGNPCPIVDRDTGTVCLLFCKNIAEDKEEEILSGKKQPRSVWKTFSYDDGLTWSEPERINIQARLDYWTWYATGPCHGIQTKRGRYIVPCNHAELNHTPRNVTRSHIIYSDDKGESWNIGGMCDWRTNEACIAQTKAGLYINMRSNEFGATRAYAFSKDEGITFSACKYTEELIDPYCQGSVKEYKNGLLFCNPASEKKRENLTLRFSTDSGKSWKESLVIENGQSAYSDITINNEGKILVLYECGQKSMYDCIVLAEVEG